MKYKSLFKPPGFYATITTSIIVVGIISLCAVFNPNFAGSLDISIGKEGGSISIQKQSK